MKFLNIFEMSQMLSIYFPVCTFDLLTGMHHVIKRTRRQYKKKWEKWIMILNSRQDHVQCGSLIINFIWKWTTLLGNSLINFQHVAEVASLNSQPQYSNC